MVGDCEGVSIPLESMEHSNKSCDDRMNVIDGEEEESTLKKQKFVSNANEVSNAIEGRGGGVVQHDFTLINIVSSACISIRDDLRDVGVAKGDGQCLKEE